MNLFVNELSISKQENVIVAKEKMQQFVACVKAGIKQGIKEIKVLESFLDTQIASDYSISNWLYDNSVDRDDRELLGDLANKSPFCNTLLTQKEKENERLFEFFHQGNACVGLGLTYLFDTMAISLIDKDWEEEKLSIVVSYISDDDPEPTPRIEEVRHLSETSHCSLHQLWFESKRRITVQTGSQLWLRRKQLFPKLDFCNSVKRQLESIPNNDLRLIHIRNKLDYLNSLADTWLEGETFNYNQLPKRSIHPDSDSRDKQFEQELTILCSDNKERFFTWKANFSPGHGKLYFFPDNEQRKIYIGYIGYKLL